MNFIPAELARDSRIGSLVSWVTLAGVRNVGVLVDWDNGTAIVDVGGREVAVRAD